MGRVGAGRHAGPALAGVVRPWEGGEKPEADLRPERLPRFLRSKRRGPVTMPGRASAFLMDTQALGLDQTSEPRIAYIRFLFGALGR